MAPASRVKKSTGAKRRPKKANGEATGGSTRIGQIASLQQILEHLPGAIISLDREGRIQHMNMEARALLGQPAGDLRLEDWSEKFGLYLDDNASLFPVDRLPPRRALQGEQGHFEEMILRRNGAAEKSWILMTARPVDGSDGLPAGATAFIREITERKQNEISRERYARRIEAFYRLTRVLASGSADIGRITQAVAALVSDTLGDLSVITLFHRPGERITISAFHDTDPFAQTLFEQFASQSQDYPSDQGLAAQVIRSGEPLLIPAISRQEMLEVSSPRFKKFVEQVDLRSILIVPMLGRSGILGTINVFRHAADQPYGPSDQSFLMEVAYRTALAIEHFTLVESLRAEIAARVTVKAALDASQERFRTIFESTPLGIKVLDTVGTILETNFAFQKMLGYTNDEMAGRNFYDFLHPDDVYRALEFFNGLKTRHSTDFRFEHRTIHKNGSTVWVKTTFTGVNISAASDGPAFIFGILENTTEQKHIEAGIAELQKRLQSNVELERLRMARELHDGPMQELYSAMYRVKQLGARAEPQLRAELDHVGQDIQQVLHDLRATAKDLRPPAISHFGLEKAIRSHAEDFLQKYPDIKLHLKLAQDRQLLPEDMRLSLFRVYQQAMGNVVRHAGATEIWVHFTLDAEEARLEIADNGQGFKVPHNWLGLVREGHYGLAGAVERMSAVGGSLQVESNFPQPTTVRAVIQFRESAVHSKQEEQKPIINRARDLI